MAKARSKSTAARLRLAGVLPLLAAAGLTWYAHDAGMLDLGLLRPEADGGAHWASAVLVSFALMLLCSATPLPAEAVAIANGACFGPLAGAAITWVSATLGATLTFACSRRLLPATSALVVPATHRARLDRYLDRWGKHGLLLARLVPAVPFFALNFAAALLPVTMRDYVSITAIAILPHALLFSALGGYL